jgi:hypothetical protein
LLSTEIVLLVSELIVNAVCPDTEKFVNIDKEHDATVLNVENSNFIVW